VSIPFKIGNNTSTFKFGGKYRDDERTNVFNDFAFVANGSKNITLAQVLSSFSNPNYYFGLGGLGPLPDLDAATNIFNSNPGAFSSDPIAEAAQNASNNFTTGEKISAGYAMDTLQLGSLRVQAGVRVEHTSANYTGFQTLYDVNGNYVGATPVAATTTYTDVDPSVQLRYEIDKDTNIRAVYGQGIARPDIVDLVPTIYVSDQNRQLSEGNPHLVPTRSKSYDLLFEHFLGSVGLISAGGFYKSLSNPIYSGTQLLTSGQFAGFLQSSPVNGPSAKVYGVEVAWQQHLTFLPGWLSGFGILANYTYTDSSATFCQSGATCILDSGRTDTPRLQRTTPNEANLNITYDKGGFSLRGALTYNSATLYGYGFSNGAQGGITGPLGDTYINAHTQIDAQASYIFKSGFKVLASLLNINNQVFGFYNGSPQFNIQREFYGPTLFLGVSLVR
jgi:TonB-dependent receptor